jgi:desulfoferrodoxin-like iron-binding protein
MSNLLGRRYKCATCGTELLCLKAGDGTFTCCTQPMVEVEVETLPAAD